MQYIRELRFEKARQALLRADPEGSVTDIALRFGFGHLGRFSVDIGAVSGNCPPRRWESAARGRPEWPRPRSRLKVERTQAARKAGPFFRHNGQSNYG